MKSIILTFKFTKNDDLKHKYGHFLFQRGVLYNILSINIRLHSKSTSFFPSCLNNMELFGKKMSFRTQIMDI